MTDEQKLKRFLDQQIHGLAARMVEEGVTIETVVDRFATFAVAQACSSIGAFETVNLLHRIADQVAAGKLAKLEPRGTRN